jgi:two-component system response regulator FlrC
VRLPPLRERRADILPLAESLLARAAADIGRAPLELAEDARTYILGATWRGNVRGLANALERAAILADGNVVRAEHLVVRDGAAAPRAAAGSTLEDIERAAIEDALNAVNGNRREAADRLGIGLRTLYEKLRKYRGDEDETE